MRLPKLDTIIVGVFFICIALWMVSKCGNRRSDYLQRTAGTDNEREERPLRRDTVRVPPPTTTAPVATTPATAPTPTTTAPQPIAATPPLPKPTATPIKQNAPTTPATTTTAPATTKPATTTDPKQVMLYITIDGLKMRKEPGLKSATVAQLDLYEQVYFMGQKTDWKQEISLGLEKVTDRWVKVRNKDGKIGWVFGAGVNYYKEKRKGVLE